MANLSLAIVGPTALRKPADLGAGVIRLPVLQTDESGTARLPEPAPRPDPDSSTWRFPVAWILSTPRLIAPFRLAAIAGVITLTVPHFPRYCSLSRSLEATTTLIRGEYPIRAPLGCERYFRGPDRPNAYYRWEDYRRLLAYLRETYPPRTRVANFLRTYPFPTVNGPTGHMNTFPAAGGSSTSARSIPAWRSQYREALEQGSPTRLSSGYPASKSWTPG